MNGTSESGITLLLHAWSNGDDQALERLTLLVYEQLDRLAQYYMAREKAGHIPALGQAEGNRLEGSEAFLFSVRAIDAAHPDRLCPF